MKIKKITALALAAVIAIGVCGCGSDKKTEEKNKTPQEKALDSYFNACEHIDRESLIQICYPNTDKGYISGSDYFVLTYTLGFEKGLYHNISPAVFEKTAQSYYESYGFDYSKQKEEIKELAAGVNLDNENFKKLFPDFSCDYTIDKIENADNVEVYARSVTINDLITKGGEERVNIKDDIKVETGVEADEVYAAQININWSYGDMEFGNDKNWWDNKQMKAALSELAIGDGIKADSYETTVKELSKRKYNVFVYKYSDSWYIYPLSIIKNRDKFRVEWEI